MGVHFSKKRDSVAQQQQQQKQQQQQEHDVQRSQQQQQQQEHDVQRSQQQQQQRQEEAPPAPIPSPQPKRLTPEERLEQIIAEIDKHAQEVDALLQGIEADRRELSTALPIEEQKRLLRERYIHNLRVQDELLTQKMLQLDAIESDELRPRRKEQIKRIQKLHDQIDRIKEELNPTAVSETNEATTATLSLTTAATGTTTTPDQQEQSASNTIATTATTTTTTTTATEMEQSREEEE